MNKKYERYINYIVNDIQPPYFINMKDSYGLSEKEYNLVLSKVFNQPVTIYSDMGNIVYNKDEREIYYEDSTSYWYKYEYDNQGNIIYHETSNGDWYKKGYDNQENITYYENSDGYWEKYEYDNQGNNIYFENSLGYWEKKEYNERGNEIYYEDSYGNINDRR